MKHLFKSIGAGLLASSFLTVAPAQAGEFDIDSFTYNPRGWDAYGPYPAQCQISFSVLTRAHPYGRDAPSNYDYIKITAEDGSGNKVAQAIGSRYGTYANPRWILWRNSRIYIYPTPTTNGPITLKFYDTDYTRTIDVYQGELELDAQVMLDGGGGCADVAMSFNTPPVAMAGEDVDGAIPNQVVSLDGTASFDEDGDDLSYRWVQIDGPEVSLDDPTSATPSFVYPPGRADQVLTFELIVNDGTADSDEPSTVSVIHNGRSNGKHAQN